MYPQETRDRLINEAKNWVMYRDNHGWMSCVLKALLIENSYLKEKLKEIEERSIGLDQDEERNI